MSELSWRREVNDVMRHDMRTRVGIGKGYVSMLLGHYEQMTPEQRAAALRGIADAVDRLDVFSRRVLMDEKLETRDLELQRGDVAVAELVAAAAAEHPGVVVAAGELPETAFLDPVVVREILDNLLANAVAAAPQGTPVTLRAECVGGVLRFEVHDEGDGVTEADLPVLFRRYGRTEHSRRTSAAGLGLGLSIVRRLAEACGGTCGVEIGAGTTFWVRLPVSPNDVLTPGGS